MECPKCQTENPETRKFCRECGAKLLIICPECDFKNFPGDKFCGECGHELKKLKEAPRIDFSQPQSYTPKFLADKILNNRSSLEGERKLVTVLFADVANYTSIAEKLDPEEVHQIMDGCFKILMDEIHRYEGTINQFTGDGVMALFGAPVAHEDHAQRACYAALAIQKAMGDFGEKIKEERGVDFLMRIGVNSGLVVVGSIGDDLRMDYTAVGDTTNLAARMESMARPGNILVTKNTHKLARDFFDFESLGIVQVKGKEAAQHAYELIKASEVETRIEAAAAKGLTKFVGRGREMEALTEAFEKGRSGSGQVVGIVGEAGVGKSRLLLEIRNMLPQEEFLYLEGRCLHYGGSMAYLPILDILRSCFGIKEGDQAILIKKKMDEKVVQLDDRLQGALPPFQELLSLKVEDEAFLKVEPQQKRERIFEATRDLLIRESQNKPLVIAIEDLQWIDKTSEEFLDYLIGWLANTHILLILLYRPEYLHQWGSKSYYSKIGVDQLSTRTSSELVQSILEGAEVAPELTDLILNRTTGNPLFMEELTHTLLENGSIERKDNQYVLSRKASDIQVPDTVQGIIAARMDRLEEGLKRIMQVASVIGREFAFRILQTITGMKDELKSHLLSLQSLEFIYEKTLFPELEYVFKHILTQEVAYNSLLLKRRKEIHGKIGSAIEELYPERVEEFYEMIAYHYSKSENATKAYHYLKLSGKKAAGNYANWEAFRFYKEALHILTKMSETKENKRKQVEIILLMAIPMGRLAYPEDSLEILQEGEKLSREIEEEKGLAHFLGLMGSYYTLRAGDYPLGIQYSGDSFRKAEKMRDIDLMAPTGMDLCIAYNFTGDYVKATNVASKVIALLEKTQKQSESFGRPWNVYSILHSYYGLSMDQLGNFDEGKALFEKGLRFALETKNLDTLSLLEMDHGMGRNVKGDGKSAIEHLRKCIRYCEEGQSVVYLGMAWTGLGWGYYLQGDLETARKYMEKGLKIQSEAGIPYFLSLHRLLLGMVDFDSSDLENAQGHIEEGLDLAKKSNETWVEAMCKIFMGRILGKGERSQSDRAEQYILEGIKVLNGLRMKPTCAQGYLILAEFYLATGRRLKALINLKRAQKMFKEMDMKFWLDLSKKAS
jgi:class 3 adenylate cyclase/tetratricopeptide (TPR) repeat protein